MSDQSQPAPTPADLAAEIELLREVIQFVRDQLLDELAPERSLQEQLRILDTLTRSMQRLARLLLAQRQLGQTAADPDPFANAVTDILAGINPGPSA